MSLSSNPLFQSPGASSVGSIGLPKTPSPAQDAAAAAAQAAAQQKAVLAIQAQQAQQAQQQAAALAQQQAVQQAQQQAAMAAAASAQQQIQQLPTVTPAAATEPAKAAPKVPTADELQTQLNQARAKQAKGTQTVQRLSKNAASGRGYGSNSPLLGALTNDNSTLDYLGGNSLTDPESRASLAQAVQVAQQQLPLMPGVGASGSVYQNEKNALLKALQGIG